MREHTSLTRSQPSVSEPYLGNPLGVVISRSMADMREQWKKNKYDISLRQTCQRVSWEVTLGLWEVTVGTLVGNFLQMCKCQMSNNNFEDTL